MSLESLKSKLDLLKVSATDENVIIALPVPRSQTYFLGRNAQRELCIFIKTSHSDLGFDIRLRYIEVHNRAACQIELGGKLTDVAGSLIVCRTDDKDLVGLYLRLMSEAISDLGENPTAQFVGEWLQRITTLFSRLEVEGKRNLRGLWAELFLIVNLGDTDVAVGAWHADLKETFDFLSPRFAIEVKSCIDLVRIHEFSLEQLRPAPPLIVWVASVVVRPDPTGLSVLDLMKLAEKNLSSDRAKTSLRNMVFSIGGSNLLDDDRYRFDFRFAASSFRLMDTKSIPSISGDVAPEILGINLKIKCQEILSAGSNAEAVNLLAQK